MKQRIIDTRLPKTEHRRRHNYPVVGLIRVKGGYTLSFNAEACRSFKLDKFKYAVIKLDPDTGIMNVIPTKWRDLSGEFYTINAYAYNRKCNHATISMSRVLYSNRVQAKTQYFGIHEENGILSFGPIDLDHPMIQKIPPKVR